MTGPRNWDKELAAIDRAMENAPIPSADVPVQGPVRAPTLRGRASPVWARLALVLTLAAAMPFWPYARACGAGLFAYLAAVGALIGAGVWAAANAWSHRRPTAHVIALGATLWGGTLAMREVLPRVGYARVTATWTC